MDDAPSPAAWPLAAGHLGNRFRLLHYVEDAGALDAATAKALGELAFKASPSSPSSSPSAAPPLKT
jgi:hypothetical protein